MAEEFQEYEVIFAEDAAEGHWCNSQDDFNSIQEMQTIRTRKRKFGRKMMKKKSVPINIPEKVSINPMGSQGNLDFLEDGEYDENGHIVPPHVIVRRRVSRKMAFSLCSGNGRTLKGRDLCEVRNSILRMTGFLET